MPLMQTQLNALINKVGVYTGMSSHYSGAGFAGMTFKFHGLSDNDFAAWVQKAQTEGATLDRAEYLKLEKPSERDPVRLFNNVDNTLYHAIMNRCVEANKMCMDDMMAKDAMANTNTRAKQGKNVSLIPQDDVCTAANAVQVASALRVDEPSTVTQ